MLGLACDEAMAADPAAGGTLEETLKSVESLLRQALDAQQSSAALETKVDKMGAHSSKLFGMLQTKIDNLVRQMHAVEEGQKKTNKLLQDLLKQAAKSEAASAVERPSAEQRLKAASTMSATINQALRMEERQMAADAEVAENRGDQNGGEGRPMMNYTMATTMLDTFRRCPTYINKI